MAKTKLLIIILIFVSLLTISCEVSQIDKSPSRRDDAQLLVLQSALKKTDLPGSGWKLEGEGWGTDYGGENYNVTFIHDQHVFINHSLSIHPSEEQAQQAQKEWENEWIKLSNLQPAMPYVSLNQKDDYVSGCYQREPTYSLMVCMYLQRHNQIISFVKVNLDTGSVNNLTFDEINDILSVLDKRVNEMVVESAPGGNSP